MKPASGQAIQTRTISQMMEKQQFRLRMIDELWIDSFGIV